MKPFDLEAAKRGEPIQCCGLSAKFIAYEPEAAPYEQVIYLGHGNQIFTADTKGMGSHHAVVMAPKKRIVWVNLLISGKAFHYDTEESANRMIGSSDQRIGGKAYPVEIEE